MNNPHASIPYIRTLGRFSISVDGNTVANDWPSESLKVLFCSVLSPLDMHISWDRLCSSMWGLKDTPAIRFKMEIYYIRPLTFFLIDELGINPIIVGSEGVRLDRSKVNVDVFEFYSVVVKGFNELSTGKTHESIETFKRATSLYVGSFLPGIPSPIVASTRKDLESLYQSSIVASMQSFQSIGRTENKNLKENNSYLRAA